MGIQCLFTWGIGLIVSKHDRQRITGSMSCADVHAKPDLLLKSELISGSCIANVTLSRNDDPPQTVGLHVAFSADCPHIHVESWHFGIATPFETSVHAFDPTGFGAVKSTKFNAWYPAMQFSALFGGAGCTYLGIHDGRAFPKTFNFDGNHTVQAEYLGSSEMESLYSLPFRIQVIDDKCTWTDVADIYKSFAVGTEWYRRGLTVHMSRPEWMYSIPLWINTHWQTVDIFEKTGGKPETVLQRVKLFKELVGDIPMFLHWYEWDMLGYEDSDYTQCSPGSVCGFDSHYPEYFPARTGFVDAVAELAGMNVHTIPYINGRIFDQSLERWEDPRVQAAAVRGKSQQFVIEEYGNKVKFAAMCPKTQFWQQSIADIAQGVIDTAPLSGIYIDQISAASPLHCYNKNHSHAHGGGSSWGSGYNDMLRKVREQVGESKLVVTESNAEQYIGSVDTFLSLIAMFDIDHLVPAFQYVYPGGVFASAGAEFYTSDVSNNDGLWFMKKLTKQFMLGSQLGWFSLGGRDTQVPPMDMVDVLLKPAHRELVDALKRLIHARMDRSVWRFFAYGGLVMDINGDGSVWADSQGAMIILCNPKPVGISIDLVLNLSDKIRADVVDMHEYDGGEWILVRTGVHTDDIRAGFNVEARSCALSRLDASSTANLIPEVTAI